MLRRDFLFASAGFAASSLNAAPRQKPNVVLILADDLGYADLGVQGSTDIRTPNIDSIARNGVRFTNGYVSCPVCSPTRAGLMTGRYQTRFGHEFNPGPANEADVNFGLPLTETTIANRMKSLGYVTGMTGKWHLGYKPEYHPLKRGFDEFYGFLGGAHSYIDAMADKSNLILRGIEPVNEQAYLTEAIGREATSFIDRHKNDPFFLYVPFNAVHNPPQATEKYLARFAGIQDERRRILAAKLSALDDAVGGILTKLRDTGNEDDTLVIFLSDNGGPTPSNGSRNYPLRGYKGQALEGGIRIPYLMQWKRRLPKGKVIDTPVISLDLSPTIVAAAGGTVPASAKLDGVNLLPFVGGQASGAPHDRLFWRFGNERAVRMGDWKLVWSGGNGPDLYNLAKDVGEKDNLATAEPAKFKQLEAAYSEWNAQLAEPKWGGRRRAATKAAKKAARRKKQ